MRPKLAPVIATRRALPGFREFEQCQMRTQDATSPAQCHPFACNGRRRRIEAVERVAMNSNRLKLHAQPHQAS